MTTAPVPQLTLVAPAKVNLYLHVLGRRDDGMHLLDSLVIFTRLGDEITVSPAHELTLEIDGPFAGDLNPHAEDNLVRRAALALAQAAGQQPRATIRLTKNLPIAAGIGGGSADAAAALRALMALWHIADNDVDLPALALGLGADVPMCLHSRPTFVGGIGEQLTPAPVLPTMGVLFVNPGIPLATPQIFKTRAGPFTDANRFTTTPASTTDLATLLADRSNDLTDAASQCCPLVPEVLNALQASPGCSLARLSGSGATCFGLFENAAAAAAAGRSLQPSPWWVRATETINAPPPIAF